MDSFYNSVTTSAKPQSIRGSFRLSKKTLLIVGLAILFLLVVPFVAFSVGKSYALGICDNRQNIEDAKAVKDVNQDFTFPLRDDKGNEVNNFQYTIQTAELRDEIVVNGQKATSVKGRTFFIVNLKLVNNLDKPIQVNTKDYIRFVLNNKDSELLAADIHNDPVTIQAHSTKYTRLGLPIDDNQKTIKLMVGELNGNKKPVTVSF